jgi:ribonuclease P protein component
MTTDASAGHESPSGKPLRLRRRADFTRAAKSGARASTTLFTLQMARRPEAAAGRDDQGARFGFTVTRKIAGAVGRNRIRRRLKEALRVAGATLGAHPDRDYVFVARRASLDAPFNEIISQMAEGFARLHNCGAAEPRRKRKDRPAAP